MRPSLRYADVSDRVNELASQVIDAAVEVHRRLGPGFLESVYEQALAVELELRAVPFQRQVAFHVDYKGHEVGEGRMDLLIDSALIVELKAVDRLADIHMAQAISYLKATGVTLALLINFNTPVLLRGVKRVVLSRREGDAEGETARAQGSQGIGEE